MLSKLKKLLRIAPAVDYKTLIQQGATIVDVRTAGEFAAGHVKGSINIPIDQLAKSSTQLKNKNQVRSHIAPSQIELKVIMTDIDGYRTEKNVIFELPLKS